MEPHKTRLYRSIITVARRIGNIIDELTGVKGELADIAEDYETERRTCPRCGALLDETGRCPVCRSQEEL
jgi:tRNA(Ile2) C34 agmatinyltransferase TiaS